MRTAAVILKELIFPFLEKDSGFKLENTETGLWEKMAEDFLDYENNPKPIYATIYSLELNDPERIIKESQKFYYSLLEELAEQTVLNHPSDTAKRLRKEKNHLFEKQVEFLKEMKNAVTSLERERMKQEMAGTFDSISYELSDETIQSSIKKKAREDLRAKFRKWDVEKENDEHKIVFSNINYSISPSPNSVEEEKLQHKPEATLQKDKGKVISISWIKYAAAASVLIAAGLFYFNSSENRIVRGVEMVTTDDGEEIKVEKENIQLADLETYSKNLEVLKNAGLGYSGTSSEKSVKVNFINANERISSLREILKVTEVNISTNKEELSLLENRQGKYIFNGKQLEIYSELYSESVELIQLTENEYYLQKGNAIYQLKISDTPQELVQETNEDVIEELERIIFINE